MMRYIMLLFILLLGACDGPEDAVRELNYYRDARTGICYASSAILKTKTYSITLTYVPCELVPPRMLQDLK